MANDLIQEYSFEIIAPQFQWLALLMLITFLCSLCWLFGLIFLPSRNLKDNGTLALYHTVVFLLRHTFYFCGTFSYISMAPDSCISVMLCSVFLWRHAVVFLWRHIVVFMWYHAVIFLWRHLVIFLWCHAIYFCGNMHAVVFLLCQAVVFLWRHTVVFLGRNVIVFLCRRGDLCIGVFFSNLIYCSLPKGWSLLSVAFCSLLRFVVVKWKPNEWKL